MNYYVWPLLALPLLVAGQAAPPRPSPYDSAHFSWRRPVPRTRLRELQPGRPGVTESPFTVDAGHAQLEMDGLRLVNEGSADASQSRSLHLAYSTLKLGLSRRTDLQLELPLYAVAKQRPAPDSAWTDRHTGLGDATLRLKHNFLGDDQDGSLALAIIGAITLPTGGGTGAGAAEYALLLPLDLELSEQANLEGQLATRLAYDRETATRYWLLSPSTALEYDFTDHLGLVTEAVAQWDSAQRRWLASVNVAPIFKISPNVQLDFGAHFALNQRSDQEYFVGFTLRR
jgi:Putative MetA-pathway of phenol degradation